MLSPHTRVPPDMKLSMEMQKERVKVTEHGVAWPRPAQIFVSNHVFEITSESDGNNTMQYKMLFYKRRCATINN